MWSTNKRDRCLRSGLLTVNCVACVAIVYVYITYMGKEESIQGILSENIIQPEKLIAEKCTPVCESRACVWHANLLLRNVNTTADPCENFHSFLCNSFQAKFGPDEIGNVRTETKGPMLNRLKGILNNIEADPESASGKMKIVYDSCVNYGSSELQAIVDAKNFLNTIGILNWPNLPPDFSFNGISLPTILGNFIAFGAENYYFLTQVVGNETQQDRLRVELRSFSFKKATEVPRELAVSMLKYFDLETKDIDAIIEDHERVRNSIINLTEDFGCLNETCSEVSVNCSNQLDDDWNEFCETLRFVLNFMNVGEQYDMNTIIIEKPGDMFQKSLYPILHSFSNRSLANFVALSFLKGYQGEMNFYFRLSKLKHKDFTGHSEKERYELNRWKYCVRWIADKMKLSLENEFFHQYLTNSVTEEIVNLYHAYLSDLIEIVILQEWIPTETKSYLVEELKNTTLNIEILRRILPNDTYVNKVYEEFHPTKESFFNNAIGIKKNLMEIISPIDLSNREKHALDMTAFDVQASVGILLELDFGMLLPPFYVSGHISLINRILLALIGHEFGHNIFDSLEHLLENNEKLLQKKQCIEDQFSLFKYGNLNEYLNGSRFLEENMADNIETTLIDKVIELYSASQDIILPGLPYSTKQLLYMSASQMWCSKSNLEKDLLHKNLDYHAPHEFRLLGMMQNSRGHPEAFHCPEGSFMNPATKCSLLDTYKN